MGATIHGADDGTGQAGSWRVVALAGGLTINDADERRGELADLAVGSDNLSLNTLGVEAIDVTGLQLLLALKHTVEGQGRRIRLAPPPEGVLVTVLRAGGFCEAGSSDNPSAQLVFRDAFWRGGEE